MTDAQAAARVGTTTVAGGELESHRESSGVARGHDRLAHPCELVPAHRLAAFVRRLVALDDEAHTRALADATATASTTASATATLVEVRCALALGALGDPLRPLEFDQAGERSAHLLLRTDPQAARTRVRPRVRVAAECHRLVPLVVRGGAQEIEP